MLLDKIKTITKLILSYLNSDKSTSATDFPDRIQSFMHIENFKSALVDEYVSA